MSKNEINPRKYKRPRPQSPRKLYGGRSQKYIPPLIIDMPNILEAVNKLKEDGFVVACSTTNFWQSSTGQTAVIQVVKDKGVAKVQLYIRGNSDKQI